MRLPPPALGEHTAEVLARSTREYDDAVFQPNLLKDRVALVTGGGTGICRGIALAFARHGCDVAITSRKLEHLEPTRRRTARDRRARVRACRRRARSGRRQRDGLRGGRRAGRLDIVVNGAAGNFICLAENLSPNGFGTVVDIDLKGTFNVSRAALPASQGARRQR